MSAVQNKFSFFITGCGTDIGKTIVTCALIKQLRQSRHTVSAIKPVISGWQDNEAANDTLQILSALDLPRSQENIEKISPWRFNAPLAPSMAAKLENKIIDYNKVVNFCKKSARNSEYLLVEGAGGVMVPLTENKTTLDLMRDLGVPVLLVTGTYLGAISHTLTAIKTLEGASLIIKGIIVNESAKGISLQDTISELKNFTRYPIFPLRRVNTPVLPWENADNLLASVF